MDMTRRDAAVRSLARFHFHLTDLETRNSDGLDFHSVPVWAIESALRAAYEAGHAVGVATPAQPAPPSASRPGLAVTAFHASVGRIGALLSRLRRAADDYFSVPADHVTWAHADRAALIESELQALADGLNDDPAAREVGERG